jgi:hypothetical protein
MTKTVKCKSGITGWQDKLRTVYENSIELFKSYCEIYNNHKRLGFETPEEAWEANPTIQGSTNPEDYCARTVRPIGN